MMARSIGILAALLLTVQSSSAGTVSGVITVRGEPVAGVIVYLEGQVAAPMRTPGHVTMDQKDLAFVPSTLPIARGTVVDFHNSDDVEHNVFSPSGAVKKFDLGTYRRGDAGSVVFDQVGEVLVLCNIHMEMAARILVLRDPFFARSGADGSYRIEAVPPGAYTVRLWRDGWQPHTQTIDVPEAATTVNVHVPQ
jgi:plastocyanin